MSRKNRNNGNNGSNGSNGNGKDRSNDKKAWNRVTTTFRDKPGQRGILHHVRNRREETTAAICQWPDLLLKMIQGVLREPKMSDEEILDFFSFFSEIPLECLLNSFGKKELGDGYNSLWNDIREMMTTHPAGGGIATALAQTIRLETNQHIAEMIGAWMSAEDNDGPVDLWVEWIEDVSEAEQAKDLKQSAIWDIMRIFTCMVSSGFLPVVKGPGERVPEILAAVDDPRSELSLKPIPWFVADTFIRGRMRHHLVAIEEKLAVPEELCDFLRSLVEDEQGAVESLRHLWETMQECQRRWIVGDGLFRLDFSDENFEQEELGIMGATVVPEGRDCPGFGLELDIYAFGRRWTEVLEVSKDGIPELSKWPAETKKQMRGFRLWLIMRAMHAIALYVTSGDEKRDCKRSNRYCHHGDNNGAVEPTAPHVRWLPKGYKASPEAIQRCLEKMKCRPPRGKTFVASPPIKERDTTRYRPIVLKA